MLNFERMRGEERGLPKLNTCKQEGGAFQILSIL